LRPKWIAKRHCEHKMNDAGLACHAFEIGRFPVERQRIGGYKRVVTTFALRWQERISSKPMETAQENAKALRDELERVLASACFARAERISRLLRFLVERHLEGRDSELKESLIGVEVYGRNPGYDPKLDSTVRSEAVRLRARLGKYYSTE